MDTLFNCENRQRYYHDSITNFTWNNNNYHQVPLMKTKPRFNSPSSLHSLFLEMSQEQFDTILKRKVLYVKAASNYLSLVVTFTPIDQLLLHWAVFRIFFLHRFSSIVQQLSNYWKAMHSGTNVSFFAIKIRSPLMNGEYKAQERILPFSILWFWWSKSLDEVLTLKPYKDEWEECFILHELTPNKLETSALIITAL